MTTDKRYPIPHELRWTVYERDKGICQVCHRDIEMLNKHLKIGGSGFWECGHIIDYCICKEDKLDNLSVMCVPCNRLKPIHESREQYKEWVNSGYWVAEFIRYLKDELPEYKEYSDAELLPIVYRIADRHCAKAFFDEGGRL